MRKANVGIEHASQLIGSADTSFIELASIDLQHDLGSILVDIIWHRDRCA